MKAILFLSTVSSFALALVMPSAFPQERPVISAKLSLVPASESPVQYRLELNRPATQRLATSFTFYEGMTGLRCGGRCSCSSDAQQFRVVAIHRDRCGTIFYHAVPEEHVTVTDDQPDVDGHLSPEITVSDHSQNRCTRGEVGWEVDHIQGDAIRHFVGMPEALITIQ